MVILKDLKNRVYSDKQCIYFEYDIAIDKDKKITVRFFKQQYHGAQPNEWNMQIIFGRTRDKDSEVYNFGYVMPRDALPLPLIAATGLKYFQLYLKEEIQMKTNLDFELGNVLQGM